jgi:hypothetical protein
VKIADARGDVMPRGEMIRMLQDLAAPVPELASSKQAAAPIGEGEVKCRRCGKVKPRMPAPPFRNDFGKEIYANICADCWRDAIGQGTKVSQRAAPADERPPGEQGLGPAHPGVPEPGLSSRYVSPQRRRDRRDDLCVFCVSRERHLLSCSLLFAWASLASIEPSHRGRGSLRRWRTHSEEPGDRMLDGGRSCSFF